MKKLFVVLFSGILIGISFFNLSKNLFFLPVLMNMSKPYVIMRTVLVAILVCYAFVPRLRLHLSKSLLNTMGLLLITLGIVTIISPGLMGHLNDWVLLGDSIIAIEGGIIAIVLSAELPYKIPRFLIGALYLTRSIFKTLSKMFVYAHMAMNKIRSQLLIRRAFSLHQISEIFNDLTRIYEVPNKAPP